MSAYYFPTVLSFCDPILYTFFWTRAFFFVILIFNFYSNFECNQHHYFKGANVKIAFESLDSSRQSGYFLQNHLKQGEVWPLVDVDSKYFGTWSWIINEKQSQVKMCLFEWERYTLLYSLGDLYYMLALHK